MTQIRFFQKEIIEYDELLNNGQIITRRGIVISNNDINSYRVAICRVSKDMSNFNPSYHLILSDDMVTNPWKETCFLTASFDHLTMQYIERMSSRRLNMLSEEAFEKYIVWLTTQVGHHFLRWVEPHR